MLPPQSRWVGLVGIAIGNALPLHLVWTGQLQIPDLVLVYFLELVLSYAVMFASRPDRRWPVQETGDQWRTVAAMLLGALVLGPVLAIHTFGPVTWDTTTLWVVGVALASSVVGYAASIWRKGERWREGAFGSFAWRFVLMVVALMASSAGRSYDRLLDAGWEPHHLGNGWALPAGELLTRLALALELSPVVVAAGILCSYRLVSEVLHEVADIFGDEAVAVGTHVRE
ncbi:hypothetical protein [Nocardioides currus]|uniref:Uncharacterized protein n=1 Tax=Nocardioides currus TaxID=2133958 RepID=A0A2R7YZV5_9ACTN|nr:hypothetical protein [Nocardioides currus]PUA81844.1 hypothetical protein C7S10_07235 [Nocardioides currus]